MPPIAWETIWAGGAMQTKGAGEVTALPYRTLRRRDSAGADIFAAAVAGVQGRVLGTLSECDILHAVGTADPPRARMPAKTYDDAGRGNGRGRMRPYGHRKSRHFGAPATYRPSSARNWSAFVSIGGVVNRRLEQIEHEYEAMSEYIATA
jgi:hypothetical protein